MEREKTAVEFLVEQLGIKLDGWNNSVIREAKEMEKIQIVLAASTAFEDMFGSDGTNYGVKYYESKYGKV